MPDNENKTFNILSLDGGGYKGLFTATLLCSLENKFKMSCFDVFDLFAGTSTGSIIAIALALNKKSSEIKNMYLEMGRKIFSKKKFPISASFYDNKILNKELDKFYQEKTLADIHNLDKKIIIPATNLTDISTRIFKTDYNEMLNQHNKYKLADIATASCSAPLYFDSYKLKRAEDDVFEYFADGGLYANNPATLAIVEASKIMNVPLEKIRVLSIGTECKNITPRENRIRKGLLKDWIFSKTNLIATTLKTSSLIHDFIAGFILEEKILRVTPTSAVENINLDDVSYDAVQILQNEGINIANSISNTDFIKNLFTSKEAKIGQYTQRTE